MKIQPFWKLLCKFLISIHFAVKAISRSGLLGVHANFMHPVSCALHSWNTLFSASKVSVLRMRMAPMQMRNGSRAALNQRAGCGSGSKTLGSITLRPPKSRPCRRKLTLHSQQHPFADGWGHSIGGDTQVCPHVQPAHSHYIHQVAVHYAHCNTRSHFIKLTNTRYNI